MRINLILLIAGIVIGVLLARLAGCNNTADCPEATVIHDTILSKDSTGWYTPTAQVVDEGREPGQILPADLPQVYTPKAHKVSPAAQDTDTSTYSWWHPDTPGITFPQPVQPETVYYNDTARTKYGNVIIQDTLQNNRIKARRVLTELQIPTTTKTITLHQPLHNRLYLGLNAMGSDQTLLMGAGPSILLETKGGKGYEAGAYFTGGGTIYHAGIKFNLLHQ